MFVFLSFHPVFTIVCHGSYLSFAQVLSFHTCTITSPLLQNADCPFSGACLPLLGHMECLLALTVPRTLTFFCLAMFEVISQCYKNCLDRCDDFGLSFCLKVITLCLPSSFPQLSISPCCRYNPIPPHHSNQHSIFYFPFIIYPKFQVTRPWDHGFFK